MKALVSFSSGKDSVLALDVVRRAGELDVVGLLTTVTQAYGRVAMHGTRIELLRRQADALELPCTEIAIPSPCSNEEYERAFAERLRSAKADGITHVVFGDLFLRDIRAYRERQLAAVGLEPVFPLWDRPTRALAEEMIARGIVATLTCIDPRHVPRALAGHRFDRALLDALPATVDPCGENGEFHTFVSDGPGFRRAIDIDVGAVVERDGFVFADVTPAGAHRPIRA